MTALPPQLLRTLGQCEPREAWRAIFEHSRDICLQPLPSHSAASEVIRRERQIAEVDLALSGACWDLWRDYDQSVERTTDALANWWEDHSPGRAVLILDGLSLREAPQILDHAMERGFRIDNVKVTGAELPADTIYFAKALGFGQRSALDNNGATGLSHRLKGARTETGDMAWKDCADCIGSEPDWVFWHHWPDKALHDLDGPGDGIEALTADATLRLSDDSFWIFLERLATGRRLVITSDHGYAASGLFADASDEQGTRLKEIFKSGRWTEDDGSVSALVPPVDLCLSTTHSRYRFALGRRKWKSQGGYPTLSHGGLTILEVAVPFIELTRANG